MPMCVIMITMPHNETPHKESPAKRWWRPDLFERRREYLLGRAQIMKDLRAFFDNEGYVEVESPALQVSPGLEPHLTAFQTNIIDKDGIRKKLYLHTSPEFAMKKLLAAGMHKIFQVSHVFRDEEWSKAHHPEFTMVEWYAVGMSWRQQAEEGIELVRKICGPSVEYAGKVCDLNKPCEIISVQEAFERTTGIDILKTVLNPHNPDTNMLRFAAETIGIRTDISDTWEDIFFRIFLDRVEHTLGTEVPTVLHSYPTPLAALARVSKNNPRLSERFEVFVCGLELANGYGELTDADEQRVRFEEMTEQRKGQGLAPYPIDESFMEALESGIPDCAGIAMGFDRLVMIAVGATQIENVLWVPVETT